MKGSSPCPPPPPTRTSEDSKSIQMKNLFDKDTALIILALKMWFPSNSRVSKGAGVGGGGRLYYCHSNRWMNYSPSAGWLWWWLGLPRIQSHHPSRWSGAKNPFIRDLPVVVLLLDAQINGWGFAGWLGVWVGGWGRGLCRVRIWSASGFVWFVSLNLLLDFPIDKEIKSPPGGLVNFATHRWWWWWFGSICRTFLKLWKVWIWNSELWSLLWVWNCYLPRT